MVALGKGPFGEKVDAKITSGVMIVVMERSYTKGDVLWLRLTPGNDRGRGCVVVTEGHVKAMEKAKLAVLMFEVYGWGGV